jgi:tetratricopeptide (TPR) repeat protein
VRGVLAHIIIRSLSKEEQNAFIGKMAVAPKGSALVKLCGYLIEGEKYSDAFIMQRLNIKRSVKDGYLERIGRSLLGYDDGTDSRKTLATIYDHAKRLLGMMYFEEAKELLNEAQQLAAETEVYTAVIDHWELVDYFPEPPLLSGISSIEAMQRLKEVLSLSELFKEVGEARNEATFEQKVFALETIRTKALEFAENALLCKRARFHFLNTMAYSHSILGEYEEAIRYLQALVELVEQHPFVCADSQFVLAKELRILATLYQWVGQKQLSSNTFVKISKLKATTLNADFKKTSVGFPPAITIPLDAGNVELGVQACIDLGKILTGSNGHRLSKQFKTENLYWGSYFYFAAGDRKGQSQFFKLLSQFRRADWRPRYFVAYKLLLLVRSIEQAHRDAHWVAAFDDLERLRTPVFCEEMPGLEVALEFLNGLIEAQTSRPNQIDHSLLPIHPAELRTRLKGLDIVDYFDINSWIEAMNRGCLLIEVFKQQTDQGS